MTALRRPRYALLTGTAAAITCFFAASYVNADISRYYVGPALMAWTWLAILAAAVVDILAGAGATDPAAAEAGPDEARLTSARRATARTRAALLSIVIAIALIVPTLAALPERFRVVDASGQRDAARWADHVLDVMEPGGVIVSWWSYSTPLWYEHLVEGKRPDIEIIDDRTRLDLNMGGLTETIDFYLGKRPVYVLRLDRREVALLAARYDLDYIDGSDASSLTRVIGLKAAAS